MQANTMKIYFSQISAIFLILLLSTGCEEKSSVNHKTSLGSVNYSLDTLEINKLSNKNIFFGHQSVGFNIVSGIAQLSALNPDIVLNVQETRKFGSVEGPAFFHSTIGDNEQPILKIHDFEKILAANTDRKIDIAFLKLCYLDVNKTTDIDSLFNEYVAASYRISELYPGTILVHITVPLTVADSGIRSLIKKLLGKPDNNIARASFNKKLIEKYGSYGRVFDLARIESTYPDGGRSSFEYAGKEYYSLVPEYAADSGHLNELGAIVVGKELLNFLAALN